MFQSVAKFSFRRFFSRFLCSGLEGALPVWMTNVTRAGPPPVCYTSTVVHTKGRWPSLLAFGHRKVMKRMKRWRCRFEKLCESEICCWHSRGSLGASSDEKGMQGIGGSRHGLQFVTQRNPCFANWSSFFCSSKS